MTNKIVHCDDPFVRKFEPSLIKVSNVFNQTNEITFFKNFVDHESQWIRQCTID